MGEVHRLITEQGREEALKGDLRAPSLKLPQRISVTRKARLAFSIAAGAKPHCPTGAWLTTKFGRSTPTTPP